MLRVTHTSEPRCPRCGAVNMPGRLRCWHCGWRHPQVESDFTAGTHGRFQCGATTKPRRCPYCKASVFFFSCSCGCRVWFDELGDDWPKHPCLTKPDGVCTSFSYVQEPVVLPAEMDTEAVVREVSWQMAKDYCAKSELPQERLPMPYKGLGLSAPDPHSRLLRTPADDRTAISGTWASSRLLRLSLETSNGRWFYCALLGQTPECRAGDRVWVRAILGELRDWGLYTVADLRLVSRTATAAREGQQAATQRRPAQDRHQGPGMPPVLKRPSVPSSPGAKEPAAKEAAEKSAPPSREHIWRDLCEPAKQRGIALGSPPFEKLKLELIQRHGGCMPSNDYVCTVAAEKLGITKEEARKRLQAQAREDKNAPQSPPVSAKKGNEAQATPSDERNTSPPPGKRRPKHRLEWPDAWRTK